MFLKECRDNRPAQDHSTTVPAGFVAFALGAFLGTQLVR